MIFPTRAGMAQRSQRISAKVLGTTVAMTWTGWTGAKPAVDPTTGAVASGGGGAVQKSCSFKCFVHFVDMSKQAVRMNQEIETGDLILDHIPTLVVIATAGSTGLAVGAAMTEFAFNAANRAAVTDATSAPLVLSDLEDPEFTVDSMKYVQKPIGDRLAKSWDAVFSDVRFSRPILLRKAT